MWPQNFAHTLTHGVIHFVHIVSTKILEMEVSYLLFKNIHQLESGFQTAETKWITPCEKA